MAPLMRTSTRAAGPRMCRADAAVWLGAAAVLDMPSRMAKVSDEIFVAGAGLAEPYLKGDPVRLRPLQGASGAS